MMIPQQGKHCAEKIDPQRAPGSHQRLLQTRGKADPGCIVSSFIINDLDCCLLGDAAIFKNPAVLDAYDPARMLGDVFRMGNKDDRAAFGVQLFEQRQNFLAALTIEGAGGLVGENHRRVVHQRPRNRHPLLLPARKFGGTMIGAVAQPKPLQ